jgi:predicted DNA-binding antitoxin AbrB/MazE fold protein
MSDTIPAIFDGSVFKPLVPVSSEQGTRVEVEVPSPTPGQENGYSREAMVEFLKEMASLPDDSPNDGFSNQDHDRVIYGI